MSCVPDRLRAIATRLFTQRTLERVIEPILADLQCEYDEAHAQGRRWRARLGLVGSYVALGRALCWLGLQAASSTDRQRAHLARAGLVAGIAWALSTLALAMPPLAAWPSWRSDPAFTAMLFLMVVPQALPLSIPAGLCVAILWAMRGTTVSWGRIVRVLAIALVCTALVWVVLEWVMPEANQGFREMVAARLSNGEAITVERGLAELGLSRLGQRTDAAAVHQYHLLWALCFASVPLSLLAFGLARHVRRAASAVALAAIVMSAYFAILWASAARTSDPALPALLAAWIPNVSLACLGAALLVRTPAAH